MIEVPMTVSVSEVLVPMSVSDTGRTLNIGLDMEVVMATPYDDDYEYTPSEQTQTIAIRGKMATENIVINPIPSNYGLVTWDGATLTVS